MISELVTTRHLSRKAVVYIRQSHPHQVLSNQESLRLQYALCQRACDLGWREADVEVVDVDLGLSGAAAEHRRGFKDLIARVTLGEIGIILSYDVTRLARNCSDWYPLLDLCGFHQDREVHGLGGAIRTLHSNMKLVARHDRFDRDVSDPANLLVFERAVERLACYLIATLRIRWRQTAIIGKRRTDERGGG